MTLVYLILPVTLLIAAGFVFAFVRAARSGQFDDLTTPAFRAVFRDSEPSVTSPAPPPTGPLVASPDGPASSRSGAPTGAPRKGIRDVC